MNDLTERYQIETSKFRGNADEKERARGFTLLEILLVLALIALLLGGLGATIRLFSQNYESAERRVGRAQLARSISQMLSEDLGAAVQDPIIPVDDDPNRQYVRHFGLRGDSRSLQIDVVQPNLFAEKASPEENRRIQSGGEKNSRSKQAPELKTVFYEFVPLNAVEVFPGEGDDTDATDSVAAPVSGEDLGSSLSGSLTERGSEVDRLLENTASSFWNGARPLAQKHGLSRRELDYETPEEESSTSFDDSSASSDAFSGDALGGSSDSSLNNSSENARTFYYKEPMTSAQIAMDSDDGTTWAPEVLDCRFSYFDGEQWRDAWDSIEQKGLPIAIRVELKLAPLDDVDLYRQSPLFINLPQPPSLDTVAKLKDAVSGEDSANSAVDSDVDASRVTGTLVQTPEQMGALGDPVDVFNSYRTPNSILLALRGVPSSARAGIDPAGQSEDSALGLGAESSASVDGDVEGVDAAPDEFSNLGVTGTLDVGADEKTPEADAADALNSADAAMDAAQALVANGAVYNETGVCVDYGNHGVYSTLEDIAADVGVAEPIVYEVVAYLPTTPFSRSQSLERRRSATVLAGVVSTRGNGNGQTGARRGRGANPYASGTARRPRERSLNERSVAERGANNRTARERNVASRGASERTAGSRTASNRASVDRTASGRAVAERSAGTRQVVERGYPEASAEPTVVPAESAALAPDGGELGEAPVPDVAGPAFNPDALGPTGASTPLDALNDPFSFVDSTVDAVPFAPAGSGFDEAEAALGGVAPGMIETPAGTATTTVAPVAPQRSNQQQRQTWIRGKR